MRVRARAVAVIVGVTAAALLAGCTADEAEPTPSVPAPSPTPTSTPTEVAADVVADAEAAAINAMENFIARDRSPEEWWEKLAPLLSPEAQYLYEGTNPARVPASAITGDPVSTPVSGTFVTVLVPTDAGQYRLEMSKRVDVGVSDGPWLVFTLTPPEGTK